MRLWAPPMWCLLGSGLLAPDQVRAVRWGLIILVFAPGLLLSDLAKSHYHLLVALRKKVCASLKGMHLTFPIVVQAGRR